ncbi:MULTISPECIES: NADP-dependent oxidoreductase [unclassified Actinomyces]|uniref:NADP-dependent oxidoreductase n=1 Tax=unclassified Actinomyces TaxID=2609248 RepID=UPI001373BFFC|nr:MULTISPECIES: NADP-dependent oxidoreductase [unclassified Actinomyces]NDR53515.1 NADP-dependent oxidoreductase [Actinomyces sp. 565]QHO90474.1 NADPH:quinone oxidoreductase [Actinomyces sp. 432]
MKAYALTSYRNGGTLEWIEVPEPVAGPGQVVVDIRAAGLNPLDRMIAAGQFRQLISYRLPQVLGQELAGVVTEVGPGVENFTVGDHVFGRPGINRIGTFTQSIAVDADDLAPMPAELGFAEAASLPLVLLTAAQAFMEKARVKPGDKVFIQGGTGGLGSIAIQLAKHLGATVATTVSTKNVDLARELGADVVVDYRTQRYEDHVKDYDVVLDTLGKEETLRSMKVLRPGGTMVSVVGAPDSEFAAQLGKPILKPVMWMMSRGVRRAAKRQGVAYKFLFMRADGSRLAQLTPAIEDGSIKPLVGHTFELGELEQAMELSASGKAAPGKIVVEGGA